MPPPPSRSSDCQPRLHPKPSDCLALALLPLPHPPPRAPGHARNRPPPRAPASGVLPPANFAMDVDRIHGFYPPPPQTPPWMAAASSTRCSRAPWIPPPSCVLIPLGPLLAQPAACRAWRTRLPIRTLTTCSSWPPPSHSWEPHPRPGQPPSSSAPT
jgi:hypothetical protein